ncbi:MAG: hypothetical protein IT220_05055 [Flavobacteriaceae bacterium]|nr:hypothetical protein [Flavobacteriaceae bacterium]
MRKLLYLLLLFITLSCKGKKEEINSQELVKDSIQEAETLWISEDIGIQKAFVWNDTITRKDDALFAYGTNMELPKLLSKTGEFKPLNDQINSDFKTMMDEVKTNPKTNPDAYHKVQYTYYLKDSIITIKIEDLHAYHLSEATSEFYIYHYDIKNNKLLNTTEMFGVLGLSQVPILSAFAEQCSLPPDYSDPLFNTEWFDQVKWKNLNLLKFYQNEKQQIVLIYPVIENGIEAEMLLE